MEWGWRVATPGTAAPRQARPGQARPRLVLAASSKENGAGSNSATPGEGSGKAAARPERRKRRQRTEHALPPVSVSRADLTWGRPPWTFEQSCTPAELGLASAVPALDDGGTDVLVTLRVDGGSGLAGYSCSTRVTAGLRLRCEMCGERFEEAVVASIDTWLNGEVAGEEELTSASELAWPPAAPVCDMSPVVVDAICMALPTVARCACCRDKGAPGWSSSPPPERQQQAKASPFGVLRARGAH